MSHNMLLKQIRVIKQTTHLYWKPLWNSRCSPHHSPRSRPGFSHASVPVWRGAVLSQEVDREWAFPFNLRMGKELPQGTRRALLWHTSRGYASIRTCLPAWDRRGQRGQGPGRGSGTALLEFKSVYTTDNTVQNWEELQRILQQYLKHLETQGIEQWC